ncbi:hypothetical protein [Deinococcus altitudinis]|uniref:hypothetical protein n=1 Tax=Deinococcus altitudinis TaxID=468914 RepID=UPI003892C423
MTDMEQGFQRLEQEEYELAHEDFSQASENGQAQAQYMLAELYAHGLGRPTDFERAAQRYLNAT